ncbi:MAG: 16S rRNA (guanine(527)-N(7))-methyltransferase RsmG [Burkholderiales bacterium]|nr:16S rRNA (guanine(527)-N(7))-methyltransferase RsmG [Burkholderiales bacterium]
MTAQPAPRSARPTLGDQLGSAAEALGLHLSEAQTGRLLDFVALLARWNRTYNLTAVRDPAAMLTQHVVDCLAAVPALRRRLPGPQRVLDVGSGGGLPGVVWAIVAPELDVTCVDSVGKKAAFIQQVASTLQLLNLHSEHERVEQLQVPPFDVVTSRAFASLSDFVTLTGGLLKDHGVWLAMKGKLPLDEISSLPAGVQAFHLERLEVPGLDAERCLIWMRNMAPILTINESGRLQ